MVLMRRLSLDEKVVAQGQGLDYPIFMAIAEKIGHDKRGNVIYRRTSSGEDALVRRVETVVDIDQATGAEVLRELEVCELAAHRSSFLRLGALPPQSGHDRIRGGGPR